ncbi:MAG: NAD(P)H-binding protein [Proteobacteria bacterium]|nr:NAD(P)H-binding protein [Pseudomonadota bacterium]
MRVAIIGGTGFVGGYLIESLLDAGHSVSVMVRPGSEDKVRRARQLRMTRGSLSSRDAIQETCDGCEAVIYNVGILREFPQQGITFEETQLLGVERTLAAAKKTGAMRFLLMSANGVRAHGTPYQDSKYHAEERVRNSGLEFTIFAPSVIFGDPRGRMEIATQLYADMVAPVLPAVGFYTGWNPTAGKVMMSPVHVEDVATAFVKALQDDALVRQKVHLGGPEALSWSQMIQRIAASAGKVKTIIPMPIGMMKLAALLLDWMPKFPVTRDQLTMLAEGNVVKPDELARIIGRELRRFDTESLSYLVA